MSILNLFIEMFKYKNFMKLFYKNYDYSIYYLSELIYLKTLSIIAVNGQTKYIFCDQILWIIDVFDNL